MEEPPEAADFSRRNPDLASAYVAMDVATEMLNSAIDKYHHKTYGEAFIESRNSVRIAASALLLKDGFIASTFDATIRYLEPRYSNVLPLDSWSEIESIKAEGEGIIYLFLKLIGKIKKPNRQQAKKAIITAEQFLNSLRMMVELR